MGSPSGASGSGRGPGHRNSRLPVAGPGAEAGGQAGGQAGGRPTRCGAGCDAQADQDSGRIRLGYLADARPYSFKDGSGNPAGFAVDLCGTVTDAIKGELGLSALAIDWVAVTSADQYKALQQGNVDLMCGSARQTLSNRTQAAFSITIFPGGIGALVRNDASARLKDVLLQRKSARPNWRGNAVQLLHEQFFSVVTGSPAEAWVQAKMKEFQLSSTLVHVDNYDAGFKGMVNRQADAFFGDRAILLDALQHNLAVKDLQPIDRLLHLRTGGAGAGAGRRRLPADRGSDLEQALHVRWDQDGVCEVFRPTRRHYAALLSMGGLAGLTSDTGRLFDDRAKHQAHQPAGAHGGR